MGFLDIIFGSSKAKKQGMLFSTSLEVEKTLFHIGTLNQEQRSLIKSMIVKFMGSGGVTVSEFQMHILPELYKMMQAGKISSVDYQKLKKLIYK
ncbi:hypothetical protein HZB93_02435 [Candidatus Falkowbacteria bacterium]|nr:hypothetical protein [Candidatus Falkowbacteria bacterium]